MNISKIIKRYKYFLIFLFVLILVSIYNNEFGVYAFKNIKSSLIQMLSVLPPVMILLGLMDEWIPREYFMKYMGDSSKILGILLSFIFAFVSLYPINAMENIKDESNTSKDDKSKYMEFYKKSSNLIKELSFQI